MEVKIQCIHCDVDQQFQGMFTEKLYKLSNKYNWIESVTVYLKIEKNQYDRDKVVELLFHITGPDIYSKAQEETFELAGKKAIEGMRRQLKKHKEKDFAHPKTKKPTDL